MRTAAEILGKFGLPPPPPGRDRYYSTCPRCSATRSTTAHRKSECVGITIDATGVKFGCNHCGWTGGGSFETKSNGHADRRAGGQTYTASKIAATYNYVDESDVLLFQVLRFEPKDFRQRRPDGEGGYIWNLDGVRRVPYRLPELIEAIASGHSVVVVEGEKDADALHELNIVATTNSGGAGKWRSEYSEFLRGADVVLAPDNDETGAKHMEAVARSLRGVARSIRLLTLPGLPPKGDVSDWLAGGGTPEGLWSLVHKAPHWRPSEGEGEGGGDDTQSAPNSAHRWDEPDWSILDDRRGELPEFPVGALPASLHDWLHRAARGAGVTVGHVAVPLLGIASSLIGTARRIRASRSWSQPMTCWAAVVGFSGTGKTPGIDATKRALAQIECQNRSKVADLQRAHEGRVEAAKAARAVWKEEVKSAAEGAVVSLDKYRSTKKMEPLMPPEAIDPGPFVAPRLHVSNVTIERLAALLQVRPQGMLMLSDELAGLFLNMRRYSGGQDNEFWLEAWNGGQYTVERMGRPPITVDHLLVGIVGGMQPDKVVKSFSGDFDGMYARFLFAWPPEPDFQELNDEVDEIEPEIVNALTRLNNLPEKAEESALVVRSIELSGPARDEFEQFRQFLHLGKEQLDGREREWWAKGSAHVLRLAGTLAYLDWAFTGGPEPSLIEARFVQAATQLVRDYFWPHSRAVLRQIGLSDRHANARRALRWMRANKRKQISVQDVRRDALAQSLDEKGTRDLLTTMVKAGWLRETAIKTGKGPGRHAHRWEVNPLLHRGAENAENAENAQIGPTG
jgi:Protein of unknown function (DUF3987)